MHAQIIRHRPREGDEDSYAGTLHVDLHVGLDDSDDPVRTLHDVARLLLSCADSPLRWS